MSLRRSPPGPLAARPVVILPARVQLLQAYYGVSGGGWARCGRTLGIRLRVVLPENGGPLLWTAPGDPWTGRTHWSTT